MAMMVLGGLGLAMVELALVERRIIGRWSLSVVLLSSLVAVFVAIAVFSSDGGLKRKDDVDALVRGYADSLRLDTIHGDVHHRETAPGCAATLGLEEDEAWYERNTYSFSASGLDSEVLYRTTVSYFEEAGFAIDRLAAPLSGSRGLRALRDDVAVLLDFVGAGANFTVTVGPCAIKLSPVGDSYEVVES